MKPVAIVGGGITGLTAAYTLHKNSIPFVLYEASPRFGGSLDTHQKDGVIIEGGADSWITAKPWAADLARELGIADQLVSSNDAERATYIVRRGELVPMPRGMKLFVPADIAAAEASALFSRETKRQFKEELRFAPRQSSTDESVASFAERHFGREMVESLVDPLLAGVYGMESSTLSAHAVIPAFVEAERTHGSLIKAFESMQAKDESIFTTFRNGMSTLVDALVAKLPAHSLRLNSPAHSVKQTVDGQSINGEAASAVILAVSPLQAASLEGIEGDLADELLQFTYGDALTIALIYELKDIAIPVGFGFLVPRSEGREMIACTFVHQKWPGRVPKDLAMLRVFFNERILRTDDQIATTAQEELQAILGIAAKPRFTMVHRWPQAMPQYSVGHIERMKRIYPLARQCGVHLAGNAYRGIGVSDCVREGARVAQDVIAQIRP
jgi:oxygen-dependent protoporphyrinogen oxidase